MTGLLFEITLWILGIYFVCVIVCVVCSYIAAFIHCWSMDALYYSKYWFDKGTTLQDLCDDFNHNDTFRDCNEAKYYPLLNIFFGVCWLICEILLFLLTIIAIIIRLLIIIIYDVIYLKCLSKITDPCIRYLKSINWPNTWIVRIYKVLMTIFNHIKQFILNLRIS